MSGFGQSRCSEFCKIEIVTGGLHCALHALDSFNINPLDQVWAVNEACNEFVLGEDNEKYKESLHSSTSQC